MPANPLPSRHIAKSKRLTKISKPRLPAVFTNLLAIVCLLFLVAFAIIVFGPRGSGSANQFAGVNFYLAAGRLPSPHQALDYRTPAEVYFGIETAAA